VSSAWVADLALLLQAIGDPERARRLARMGGRIVMLMGVIVVTVGALAADTATMLEGTLVALLGFAAGWAYSRLASIILALLMALGIATGLAVGAATIGLLVQVAVFGVCLRLVEATWHVQRARRQQE
jgi:type IV secretion system protein TrbC